MNYEASGRLVPCSLDVTSKMVPDQHAVRRSSGVCLYRHRTQTVEHNGATHHASNLPQEKGHLVLLVASADGEGDGEEEEDEGGDGRV